MKKTLLAVAITALSANAFAASINYTVTSPAPVVNTVAKEVVAASNIALTTVDTVTWATGFSVTNQNLVRLDLTNGAKFTANPTMTIAGQAATISAGGLGATYVIFQAGAATSGTSAAPVVLSLNGLTAATQADISIGYKLFSTQPDAVANNNNTVATGSYPYATFANGLVFSADPAGAAASKQIDVTKQAKLFTTGAPSTTSAGFGGLNLSVKAATYGADLTAGALSLFDMVGGDAVVTVSGNFSAAAPNGAGTLLGGIPATSLNADKTAITFKLATTAPVAPIAGGQLVYAATGLTAISPSVFNAKLTLGTGAKVTSAPADVTGFATLAKNGATATVDLALKPGGAYSNYVRISNKSSIAGNVYITVINDSGDSRTINLGDVAGQTTSILTAGASTNQITIQDIYNAAAAKGLTLTGDGKLRLVVDAEITNGELSVQTYTTSKDANSFSTF